MKERERERREEGVRSFHGHKVTIRSAGRKGEGCRNIHFGFSRPGAEHCQQPRRAVNF